jgi:hypothetical protein
MNVQGAKLQYGHVPLYVRGDDDKSRRYPSLHAVQRHMVDTNQCKMVFEGNEEEYDAFYADSMDEAASGKPTFTNLGLWILSCVAIVFITGLFTSHMDPGRNPIPSFNTLHSGRPIGAPLR